MSLSKNMNQLIMEAIDLSNLAYKSKVDILKTLKKGHNGLKDFICVDIHESDIQGFFCIIEDIAWVIIRGTEIFSWSDWKTNLSTEFTDTPWGKAHKGFFEDAVSAMGIISKAIKRAKGIGHKVIFSGHSQGAAVATQMFAQFPEDMCIPIEAPRSFSKDAAKLFGKEHGCKIYPVVNNNDPVWNMPPELTGYRHVYDTNVQYMDRKGVVRQGVTKWNKFYDSIMGYFESWLKLKIDSLEDHSIDNIAKIWRKQL